VPQRLKPARVWRVAAAQDGQDETAEVVMPTFSATPARN